MVDSHLPKMLLLFALTISKMLFILCSKLFSFLYLIFCPDFFGHAGKRLDIKAKVNFKIHDVTDWERNTYNAHIAQ